VKNSKITLSLGVSILIALWLASNSVSAQAYQAQDARVGCIYHDSTGMRFIDAGHRTQAKIVADVQAAYSSGGNAGDPCLGGRLAYLPASVYAALAARYPTSYQPLPPTSGATLSNAAAAGVPFNTRYAFADLDALVPPGFVSQFTPVGVAADGRVFGTLSDTNQSQYVAEYDGGSIKPLVAGVPAVVSPNGTVGGWIVTDPANGFTQAAIFRGNSVELIPRLTGEIISFVELINDTGTAIVGSFDANFNLTVYSYLDGKTQPVAISINGVASQLTGLNNAGVLVGFEFIPGGSSFTFLAFRYDVATATTTVLPPLPTDPNSWAMGINQAGDVVGYSWGNVEHVGIWPAAGGFDLYFLEGTPQYPTTSYSLLINDRRLIVITATSDGQSYLVPTEGVRVPLVNLIDYDPSTQGLTSNVYGLNDLGALVGTSSAAIDFLLTPEPGK
jgi:uncharacterized membrane protein